MPARASHALPYLTLMTCHQKGSEAWRCYGTAHKRLELAIRKAEEWHAAWVRLCPESIYYFDWKVMDVRTYQTVWRWEQL